MERAPIASTSHERRRGAGWKRRLNAREDWLTIAADGARSTGIPIIVEFPPAAPKPTSEAPAVTLCIPVSATPATSAPSALPSLFRGNEVVKCEVQPSRLVALLLHTLMAPAELARFDVLMRAEMDGWTHSAL